MEEVVPPGLHLPPPPSPLHHHTHRGCKVPSSGRMNLRGSNSATASSSSDNDNDVLAERASSVEVEMRVGADGDTPRSLRRSEAPMDVVLAVKGRRGSSAGGDGNNADPSCCRSVIMAAARPQHFEDPTTVWESAMDAVRGEAEQGEKEEEEEAVRPGSPFPHRQRRKGGPLRAGALLPTANDEDGDRTPVRNGSDAGTVGEHPGRSRPPPMLRHSLSEESITFSMKSSGDSGEEVDANTAGYHDGNRATSRTQDTRSRAVSGTSPPALLPRSPTSDMDDHHGSAGGGAWGQDSDGDTDSPPSGVTLWGVSRDLRRKRIKKVSHYILGPLLGEGTDGVVRDCIDLSTDNVDRRFSRCAIKVMSNAFTKTQVPTTSTTTRIPRLGRRGVPAAAAEAEEVSGVDDDYSKGAGFGHGEEKRATLTRTSGFRDRHHGEADGRPCQAMQRKRSNLYRFHSKYIVRAIDAFTRYGKEYIVFPIAVCNLQQLVRGLLRTRWQEALRAWHQRQRSAARGLQWQSHGSGRGVALRDEEGEESDAFSSRPRGLPLLPSCVDILDIDDVSFLVNRNSEDDNDPNVDGEDWREGIGRGRAGPGSPHNHGDRQGERTPHDDDNNNSGAADADAKESPTERDARRSPRVCSAHSSSTTTTTTTTNRTIDSYTGPSSGLLSATSRSKPFEGPLPTFAGGGAGGRERRRSGEDNAWEEGTCDSSSSGTAATETTCISLMGSTPPTFASPELPTPSAGCTAGGSGGRFDGQVGRGSAAATPSPSLSPERPSRTDRPRLTLPVCSPTLLKGILCQVLSGVLYLHEQGLAHNDIKPANLLLFEDGSVKLGDLGGVSETYNDQGSPLWASPELCKYFYGATTPPASFSRSIRDVGRDAARPSDMWCCGLLLYYLITGKPGPLPAHQRYVRAHHRLHRQQRTPAELFPDDGPPRATTPPLPLPAPVGVTRYQLYREISEQTAPVDLSDVPDIAALDWPSSGGGDADAEEEVVAAQSTASRYPPSSVRSLLAGLLELDPARRLTAEQALRHPWMRMAFRSKGGGGGVAANRTGAPSRSSPAGGSGGPTVPPTSLQQQQPPSQHKTPTKQAMEDAIQRDVARRVTASRHVQLMLRLDRQRHLQFVADCCHILRLPIPPEIVRAHATEPYREEDGGNLYGGVGGGGDGGREAAQTSVALLAYRPNSLAAAAAALAQRKTRHAGGGVVGASPNGPRPVTTATRAASSPRSPNSRVAALSAGQREGEGWTVTSGGSDVGADAAVTGVVMPEGKRPATMPPGCVDTELFLPYTEENYYERKSGSAEFDVRVLRRKPLLMAQLAEYLYNVVLVRCGYRTGADPSYQAMRLRTVPLEDEQGGRGGGHGSPTQQPSITILPGVGGGGGGGLHRIGASASMPLSSPDQRPLPGDAAAGDASVDVWGAGPRHQPRIQVGHDATLAAAGGGEGGSATAGVDGRYVSTSASFAARGVTVVQGGWRGDASSPATASPGARDSSRQTRSNTTSADTGDRRAAQAVVGVPVEAHVSSTVSSRHPSSGGGRGEASSRGRTRGGRHLSESLSDEDAATVEANVAMRESSKCLCGLV